MMPTEAREGIEVKRTRDEEGGGAAKMAKKERGAPKRARGDSRAEKDDGEGDVDMDEVDASELVVNLEDEGAGQFAGCWEAGEDLELDPEKVAEARKEELEFMLGIGVWEESTWEDCLANTGKPPVTTKWVDIDKGRNGEVKVRSRLVARDFRVKGDDRQFEVFAAMPPIEAKRLLFRMAMMDGAVGGDKRRGAVKLMFVDIKKAHLNGKLTEEKYAYVQLPLEAGGGIGRLRRWLYGMRPAASAWEEDYSNNLESIGFKRGKSASTTFFMRRLASGWSSGGMTLLSWGGARTSRW